METKIILGRRSYRSRMKHRSLSRNVRVRTLTPWLAHFQNLQAVADYVAAEFTSSVNDKWLYGVKVDQRQRPRPYPPLSEYRLADCVLCFICLLLLLR